MLYRKKVGNRSTAVDGSHAQLATSTLRPVSTPNRPAGVPGSQACAAKRGSGLPFGHVLSNSEVRRVNETWTVYRAEMGMLAKLNDVVVPPGLEANEIAVYLDDIFRELAGIGQCVELIGE
jgi:hypothetical protein